MVIAAAAGLIVAIVAVVGGYWLAAALDDGSDYDGNFVLTEPGIFDEPPDDLDSRDLTGAGLPDVALIDVDGAERRIDGEADRPKIVNVWFSTCPPCARELVDFAAIDSEFGDRIDIIGVNPQDTVEVMQRFAAERDVTYELLRDDGFRWVGAAGILAYPVTYFVDERGRVVAQAGEVDAEELRARIANLFAIR